MMIPVARVVKSPAIVIPTSITITLISLFGCGLGLYNQAGFVVELQMPEIIKPFPEVWVIFSTVRRVLVAPVIFI